MTTNNTYQQTQQNSIKWMLEKWPNETLWLITKEKSLRVEDCDGPPVYYWLIGLVNLEMLKVGNRIVATRFSNTKNPEGRRGMFSSSEIVSVDGNLDNYTVTTKNSVYSLKKISK